jgi:hypothetical protein
MEDTIRNHYNSDSCFDRVNVFRSECRERCKLNGDLSGYLILNGDEIKKALKLHDVGSADCILIDKNAIDGKYKIIICELSTNKTSRKVKKQLSGSGEHIVKVFNENNLKIKDICCLFLGKYSDKTNIRKSRNIVNIPNFCRNDVKIINKDCRGFDISDLNF